VSGTGLVLLAALLMLAVSFQLSVVSFFESSLRAERSNPSIVRRVYGLLRRLRVLSMTLTGTTEKADS